MKDDLLRTCSSRGLEAWLQTECKPAFHHEVVLAACLSSFNGTPSADAFWTSFFDEPGLRAERCRVVISMLVHLSSTREEGRLLSETDLQIGFSRLLALVAERMEETEHKKEVMEHLVRLLRFAVEKELLPAQFLKVARRLRYGGPVGVQALRQAQQQTPLHSRRVWGSGDARQLRSEMHDTIAEFFDSRDSHELAQVLEELHLSGKEQATFLRKLLTAGMERDEAAAALDVVQELLGFCWSEQEVQDAFQELRDVATDLVLDFPQCRERTGELVIAAVEKGLLHRSYLVVDAAFEV